MLPPNIDNHKIIYTRDRQSKNKRLSDIDRPVLNSAPLHATSLNII